MKKKRLLERLFDGEIYPSEQVNPFDDKEYAKELREIHDAEDTFTSALSSEQRKAFENIINARASLTSLENVEHFSHGFCLGAQLMVEILQKEV